MTNHNTIAKRLAKLTTKQLKAREALIKARMPEAKFRKLLPADQFTITMQQHKSAVNAGLVKANARDDYSTVGSVNAIKRELGILDYNPGSPMHWTLDEIVKMSQWFKQWNDWIDKGYTLEQLHVKLLNVLDKSKYDPTIDDAKTPLLSGAYRIKWIPKHSVHTAHLWYYRYIMLRIVKFKTMGKEFAASTIGTSISKFIEKNPKHADQFKPIPGLIKRKPGSGGKPTKELGPERTRAMNKSDLAQLEF